jgi:tRNA(Ile2)-agmatinylcytidine synthase
MELPVLVRLNPTIPYKTRGNACVGINIETSCPDKVMEHVISRVSTMAALDCDMTNPGVVFVQDDEYESVRDTLGTFFQRAVREVLSIEEAKSIIEKTGLKSKGFKMAEV